MSATQSSAVQTSAKFSRDRRYRYYLKRRWNPDIVQTAVFVGLNPSAADESSNDPTIRRCLGFASGWGGKWRCGSLYVVNLFAYCTADPASLRRQRDPAGPRNRVNLTKICSQPDSLVIAMWGNHGTHRDAASEFVKWCGRQRINLFCLKANKTGEPAHPLYLPGNLTPKPYRCA